MRMTGLLLPLVATVLIEYAVLLLLRERRRRVLLSSVAINIVTNVSLNVALMLSRYGFARLFAGEAVVMVVEALWYRWFTGSWRQAVAYSFLCNAISFLCGALVQLSVMLFQETEILTP